MNEIKIIRQEQLNEFADETKANNGGGYDHVRVFFKVNGKRGMFEDTSCGEFGTRKFITFNGKAAFFGSMLDDEEEFSEFNGATIEEKILMDHFNIPVAF